MSQLEPFPTERELILSRWHETQLELHTREHQVEFLQQELKQAEADRDRYFLKAVEKHDAVEQWKELADTLEKQRNYWREKADNQGRLLERAAELLRYGSMNWHDWQKHRDQWLKDAEMK